MSEPKKGKVVSTQHKVTVAEAAAAMEQQTATGIVPAGGVEKFLLDAKNRRKYNRKEATLKAQRHGTLVEFWRGFTKAYVTGTLPKEDIRILGDAKRFLYGLPNNPFNLKNPAEKEANAFVQADMVEICVQGTPIGAELIKLSARTVGKNRVCFFDSVLAQQLINEAKSPEEKAQRQERFRELNNLPQRDGYRSEP